ncbi:uncharacterized protein LY79DRAFT_21898 [Colletotrichum navitas]|uniref:Uncharacterized protein n=1 Tax=Colletotrichum navitas TaxID=681940 RepID=A0AAD8QD97_9PEZI|nr:uncharacterized protein LY79DRAFT_21898 [Colletotrichum navitas]KAK1600502.1 hypothetical protein LY79DRAFT_21898 [Colletotrichum navitas]
MDQVQVQVHPSIHHPIRRPVLGASRAWLLDLVPVPLLKVDRRPSTFFDVSYHFAFRLSGPGPGPGPVFLFSFLPFHITSSLPIFTTFTNTPDSGSGPPLLPNPPWSPGTLTLGSHLVLPTTDPTLTLLIHPSLSHHPFTHSFSSSFSSIHTAPQTPHTSIPTYPVSAALASTRPVSQRHVLPIGWIP